MRGTDVKLALTAILVSFPALAFAQNAGGAAAGAAAGGAAGAVVGGPVGASALEWEARPGLQRHDRIKRT